MTNLTIPEVHIPWFTTDNWRYCFLWGGRGAGAKSETVGKWILSRCMQKKIIVLCVREVQNSIADSVHSSLKILIDQLEWSQYFHITRDYIACKYTGAKIVFKGLSDPNALKSFANTPDMICWIEEGQSISAESWDKLDPTIRGHGAKIIMSCNPDSVDDVLYKRFVLSDVTKDNERIIANAKEKYKQDLLSGQLKYKNGPEYIYEEELKARATVLYLEPYDNPWFEGSSLELQMLRDKESFFELYETKWLGKPLQHNNAQIFKNKWEASVFEAPENAIFCFGADWGNTDPTVLTRCYILGDSKDQYEQILYIDYSVRIENASLNEIATLWNTVPNVPKKNTGTNKKIFADSNWPQSTQEMSSKYNFSVCSVDKWSNSVKQGIMYLKSFKKIIIHERCKDLIDEFKLYSYKVDARSGEITDDIVGKYDHGIDSIRYALSPYIKKGKSSYFDLVQHVLNQQH